MQYARKSCLHTCPLYHHLSTRQNILRFIQKTLLHSTLLCILLRILYRRQIQHPLQLVTQVIGLHTYPLYHRQPYRQTIQRLIQQIPLHFPLPSILVRIRLTCLRQIQHPFQLVSRLIIQLSFLHTRPPCYHLPTQQKILRLTQQILPRYTLPTGRRQIAV